MIGLVSVGFLLLYFANSLDKEHILFRFLTMFFFVAILLLIAKGTIQDEHCSIEINQSVVTAGVTNYTYSEYCFSQEDRTPAIFYGSMMWYLYLFIAYVFGYLCYYGLKKLGYFATGKDEP